VACEQVCDDAADIAPLFGQTHPDGPAVYLATLANWLTL
jgi:hypothetical protein